MRRLLLPVICAAMLAAVWWARHTEGNDERAYFSSDGGRYRVELTGWRFPLVHDPLSFVLGRSRKASLILDLPRIEGVVEGTEILVDPEKIRYAGRVVIDKGKMRVDLYYGDGQPVSWNGEYRLVRRDISGARASPRSSLARGVPCSAGEDQSRSAATGFTAAARRAGRYDAASATMPSTSGTVANVSGS